MKGGPRYTFFNPKLRDNSYSLGDAYEEDKFKTNRLKWEIDSQ